MMWYSGISSCTRDGLGHCLCERKAVYRSNGQHLAIDHSGRGRYRCPGARHAKERCALFLDLPRPASKELAVEERKTRWYHVGTCRETYKCALIAGNWAQWKSVGRGALSFDAFVSRCSFPLAVLNPFDVAPKKSASCPNTSALCPPNGFSSPQNSTWNPELCWFKFAYPMNLNLVRF
ncbi:hypothetical protein C8R47DRAFT_1136070 [Mycena vitilis]|nr:hypothetical protein C8R47DRAFT_1136070 [Mycena vitilis]